MSALIKIEQPQINLDEALLAAAEQGRADEVIRLLDAQAAIEATNKEHHDTPLILAAWKGHHAVVEILLKAKANVDAQDAYGHTSLIVATWNNQHVPVISTLLKATASIEKPDNSGKTALSHATLRSNALPLRYLCNAKANIETTDQEGNTPLGLAAQYNLTIVLKKLLDAKANIQAKNKAGDTPLIMATNKGYREAVALLKSPISDVVMVQILTSPINDEARDEARKEWLRGLQPFRYDLKAACTHSPSESRSRWELQLERDPRLSEGSSLFTLKDDRNVKHLVTLDLTGLAADEIDYDGLVALLKAAARLEKIVLNSTVLETSLIQGSKNQLISAIATCPTVKILGIVYDHFAPKKPLWEVWQKDIIRHIGNLPMQIITLKIDMNSFFYNGTEVFNHFVKHFSQLEAAPRKEGDRKRYCIFDISSARSAKQFAALLAGLHPRLGKNSPLARLKNEALFDPNVLRKVERFFNPTGAKSARFFRPTDFFSSSRLNGIEEERNSSYQKSVNKQNHRWRPY